MGLRTPKKKTHNIIFEDLKLMSSAKMHWEQDPRIIRTKFSFSVQETV